MSLWDEIEEFGAPPGSWYDRLSKENFDNSVTEFRKRDDFVHKYAWATPSKEAIAKIKEFAGNDGILELFAGRGLWARLLRDEGIRVTATDKFSERRQYFHSHDSPDFTDVLNMSHIEALLKFGLAHGTLLMCWPPYAQPFAAEAVESFPGDKIIYIGEPCGGCTADDRFDRVLEENYEETGTVDIPQWFGLHDILMLFTRKPRIIDRKIRW